MIIQQQNGKCSFYHATSIIRAGGGGGETIRLSKVQLNSCCCFFHKRSYASVGIFAVRNVIFSQACVKNSVYGVGGGFLPQSMLGHTHTPPGQTHPSWADTPPGQTPPLPTATAADGTHPTGMLSCSKMYTCDLSIKQKKAMSIFFLLRYLKY